MAYLQRPPKTIVSKVNFGSTVYLGPTYNNASSYWNGSTYIYQVTLSIDPQTTGDEYSSPDPFQYNGYNVEVGDWLGQPNGLCYLITDIISVTTSSLVCVIQDVDLYNIQINLSNTPQ